MAHWQEPASPTWPASPTSPTSPLHTFLDQSEDVLEWVAEWERRSTNMDEKHVEVLISQWKLMRESAKEHSKLFHNMKKAMYELRSTSTSLQDRLDELERRLRADLGQDHTNRIDSLEKRLREKINQEQANREADMAELRELLKNLRKDEDVLAVVKEHLARERQAREAGLDAVQQLLAKEAEVLREVKRHIGDETEAREKCYQALQDRLDRVERMLADVVDKQASFQASTKADLAAERERREHELWELRGRFGTMQEKFEQELKKEQALREAAMERLREQLGEQLSRERDLAAVKEMLAAERQAREQQAKLLQEMLKREAEARDAGLGEVRSELLRERSARERLGDSIRAGVEEKIAQLGTSFQERMDQVLRILQGSTGDMLQFWRGAGRAARS